MIAVDRSEADPSSSRRNLIRSNMDFVPESYLFNFQRTPMIIDLITAYSLPFQQLESHDRSWRAFLRRCIGFHSYFAMYSEIGAFFAGIRSRHFISGVLQPFSIKKTRQHLASLYKYFFENVQGKKDVLTPLFKPSSGTSVHMYIYSVLPHSP